MQPRFSHQRTAALAVFEWLVIIAILAMLAVLLLAALAAAKRKSSRINCVSNLKQVGLAFRLWEGDNNGKYPMAVSMTNGGAMELIATGNVAACFRVMSNELSTPKILLCPKDSRRTYTTNFSASFSDANISYFINLDVADESRPQMVLDGDDNLLVDGKPAEPGILNLGTNSSVGWTKERHHNVGYVGMADGSAQSVTTNGLQPLLRQTGFATNRLVLP